MKNVKIDNLNSGRCDNCGSEKSENMLSICIPTYNRSDYLDQCLASLVPQALECQIPIYLSDNASSDNTQQVIQKYKAIYTKIFSFKQEANLGHDLNHKSVITMATTEFAWLLGDDDIVLSGSLQKVIHFLESTPNCELLLLNAIRTDNDLRPRGMQFQVDQDVFITDCNDLLVHHSDKLTFGMIIINSRLFNSSDADKFLGTAHYYGGGVYEYLANNFARHHCNCIVILKDPMVYLRQGERCWSHEIGDIVVRQTPEFFKRLPPLFEVNKLKAMTSSVRSYRILYVLLRLRAEGWLDADKERELYQYYISVRFRFMAMCRMPIFIAQMLTTIAIYAAVIIKSVKRKMHNRIIA